MFPLGGDFYQLFIFIFYFYNRNRRQVGTYVVPYMCVEMYASVLRTLLILSEYKCDYVSRSRPLEQSDCPPDRWIKIKGPPQANYKRNKIGL